MSYVDRLWIGDIADDWQDAIDSEDDTTIYTDFADELDPAIAEPADLRARHEVAQLGSELLHRLGAAVEQGGRDQPGIAQVDHGIRQTGLTQTLQGQLQYFQIGFQTRMTVQLGAQLQRLLQDGGREHVVHDHLRDPCGRVGAEPNRQVELGVALLFDRRHVGEFRVPFVGEQRQHLQLSLPEQHQQHP